MTTRSREGDSAARLAVMYVLNTLRLDSAATARLLADMTNDELLALVDSAERLAERGRGHLRSRGLAA